jgi:glycosyltransferase involved in cell wall biosynthesis
MFPMNLLAASAGKPHVQLCYEPFAFFHDETCLSSLTPLQRAFFRLMARLHGPADRRATRSADQVVTLNASNIEAFKRVYGIEPKVVYWGYDTAFWMRAAPPAIAAWRDRWGPGPLLVHSTDLSGIKGSFELLAVVGHLARSLPSLKLLVTTYVEQPEARRRFEAEVRRRSLAHHVVMLGRLDRDELPLAFSGADLVVQPGSQPANGALREALLCETPIVGGLASEEVEEGTNGIRIDLRDPAEAASAIAGLLARRSALDLEAGGRQRIAERFPLTESIRDLHAVLSSAAGRREEGEE